MARAVELAHIPRLHDPEQGPLAQRRLRFDGSIAFLHRSLQGGFPAAVFVFLARTAGQGSFCAIFRSADRYSVPSAAILGVMTRFSLRFTLTRIKSSTSPGKIVARPTRLRIEGS
jgi:hypothetical protein